MKTVLILIILIMISQSNNYAQTIAGDDFIETTNGRILLSLNTTDQSAYSGTLTDDTGGEYSILAQQDGQGGIIGTLSGGQTSPGFAAHPGEGEGVQGKINAGGYTRGQWKTQDKTIYINEGYVWQPNAGYYYAS